jgi:hypothetical protein
MKRSFLLAAASAAPLLIMAAGGAHAQDEISGSINTPVYTATANNGAPEDVDITGSVGLLAPGVAVTLNSNNVITNEGEIGFTAINNAVGVQLQGGNTGSFTNSGTILVTDNYTATVDTNNDLNYLPFATGNNRTGIQVTGPGTFNGFIANYGTITVYGDHSYGVDIEAPITGGFESLEYTAATSTVGATQYTGTITVLGGEPALNGAAATYPVIGFHVGSTGSIGGDVTLSTVTATGYGAKAVDIEGSVGGTINFMGAVTATGYQGTTRSSYTQISDSYMAEQMLQGGPAVTIAGNVGAGILVSAPPLIAITDDSTANDNINGVSVGQIYQSMGTITSYGSSPAMIVGSATNAITVGAVNTTTNSLLGANAYNQPYGLVNNGTIMGDGLFDQINYPFLPAPVSATALQIGGTAGYAATINYGIYNSGVIEAQAYQASATAIHFLAGGSTPTIVNDGLISASSLQETNLDTTPVYTANAANTSYTTSTANLAAVNVYGILIEKGATVNSIVNNSGITANITGDGGVGATEVGAIVDKSGTLSSITNRGSISAQATQTLITEAMPAATVAIDMSAGTTAQTITQTSPVNGNVLGTAAYNQTITYYQGQIVNYNGLVYQATTTVGEAVDPLDYPSDWKQIGAVNPYIYGSVLMGSGGSNLTVQAGTVTGAVINLGTGSGNVINVQGPNGSGTAGALVSGAIEEVAGQTAENQLFPVTPGGALAPLQGGGNGTMTININNGTLIDLNPNQEKISGITVGANGLLMVSADPVHGTNTDFITSGASTFAQGAQIGISLLSIPKTPSVTYTVLQTTGSGTLSVGTLGTAPIGSTPWLYTASASYVPPSAATNGSSEIQLTVAQKTPTQLGFNASEAAALNAVLAAAPGNAGIQSALLSQTTETGLKSVYNQLLPSQGQSLFDALDAAARQVGGMIATTPDAASRVAGTSLWLQEVNERVELDNTTSLGSFSSLFGLVGGYEVMGPGGGAAGLTLAYYSVNEQEDADEFGTGEDASMLEFGAYFRRSVGRFTFAIRGAVGYAWFSDERVFAATTPTSATNANSATGTELSARSNWGGMFYDGQFTASYEQTFGRFYVRPELSADFLELDQGAQNQTGGGAAFDLNVLPSESERLSGSAVVAVGRQWGQATWLRAEIRGGVREVFAGSVGDTEASFNGGNPFTLPPEDDRGSWMTAGFSIKGGSTYSYLALEGDVDLRPGEQEFDLRVAGRSIF